MQSFGKLVTVAPHDGRRDANRDDRGGQVLLLNINSFIKAEKMAFNATTKPTFGVPTTSVAGRWLCVLIAFLSP